MFKLSVCMALHAIIPLIKLLKYYYGITYTETLLRTSVNINACDAHEHVYTLSLFRCSSYGNDGNHLHAKKHFGISYAQWYVSSSYSRHIFPEGHGCQSGGEGPMKRSQDMCYTTDKWQNSMVFCVTKPRSMQKQSNQLASRSVLGNKDISISN